MGFFDTLSRVLNAGDARLRETPTERRLGDAWGNEVGSGADDTTDRPTEGAGVYDLRQWERKLKHVLDGLPETRGEWADLVQEAAGLGLDPAWVVRRQRAEFALLVRRAVADRVVTEAEHRKLDLARVLIGIGEPEAEALLHETVREAEAFFGAPDVGS